MALSLLRIPSFPPYTGPHNVGTSEIEIPVSALESPAPTPESDIPLSTILFRVFYPADHVGQSSKPVYWIPEPQSVFTRALGEFVGFPKRLSSILALLPNTIRWTKIPAHQNAPLKPSTLQSKRWPVMVFSHGLGGSRNTYSYLLGCLSSYGMVVIAPEHRDGSSHISFIRDSSGQNTERVPFQQMKHIFDEDILRRRHDQLRIRLWEFGLVHDALLKLDAGAKIGNLIDDDSTNGPVFTSSLDVRSPSSITWGGHSFGAASVVQFVKSIYWGRVSKIDPASSAAEPYFSQYRPLYEPQSDSKIVSQITPTSPLVLLDLWNLPLLGDDVKWLWEKPLPCYTADSTKGQHQAANVLAIMSGEFFKWAAGLKATRFTLSNRPVPGSPEPDPVVSSRRQPRVFYAAKSAHMSQSDAGVLFPWAMKRWVNAEEPERTMQLNVTAIIQMLRECAVPFDLDEAVIHALENVAEVTVANNNGNDTGNQNVANGKENNFSPGIFATDGSIRGWLPVPLTDDSQPVQEFEVRTPPKL
ncbi:hypothetical protein GX48_03335 [Paracoccidioides brasiliensis]|nr:hypothetical protein GX48_03335 [Paracoccidioides brasiliensis]